MYRMFYQENYGLTCICCGLPVVIFLIHNFGLELFWGGLNVWGLLMVLLIGMIFTVLGAIVLKWKVIVLDGDSSSIICCGIPIMLAVILAMTLNPLTSLSSVLIVVVVGFIVLMFFFKNIGVSV